MPVEFIHIVVAFQTEMLTSIAYEQVLYATVC